MDYFYNQNWQLLQSETDAGGPIAVDQYVWSVTYVDAPVGRWHDDNNDGDYEDEGDNIRYFTRDANFNVTAAVEGTFDSGSQEWQWQLDERYVYTPYGEATVYDAAWSAGSGQAATDDGPLYCGYFFDAETSLYNVRWRIYHSTLSTWLTRDPLGYSAGDANLYRYCANQAIGRVDPHGLLGQVVIGLGSDAVGVDLGAVRVDIPLFGILNASFCGSFQALVNCKSDELAFYWYLGGGLSLATPGITVGLGAVFVWNVPKAEDYTGTFWSVDAGFALPFPIPGIGVSGFTSSLRDFFSRAWIAPMGFGLRVQWGIPKIGGGIAGLYQHFDLARKPMQLAANNPIIRLVCCPPAAAGVVPGAKPNINNQALIKAAKFPFNAVFNVLLPQAKAHERSIIDGVEQLARKALVRQLSQAGLSTAWLYKRGLANWRPSTTIAWGAAPFTRVKV